MRKGKDTRYDYDCTKKAQNETGLCRFMNNVVVLRVFHDNPIRHVYGTFKAEDSTKDSLDSIKEEDGLSFLYIYRKRKLTMSLMMI